MYIKFLNERKIRKFWENEEKRFSKPLKVVELSDTYWQLVPPDSSDDKMGGGNGKNKQQ